MRAQDYPHPTSASVTAVMKANRKRDTKPELLVRRALFSRGLRYRVNFRIVAEGVTVRPDIVFLGVKLAVFIDGCFWHSCPIHGTSPKANSQYWGPKLLRNRERDTLVSTALRTAGWEVLRIWEHETPEDAAKRILERLDELRTTD